MLRLFKKDFILFFRDHRAVILAFLLPVILITLFAFAYGSFGAFDVRRGPVEFLVADLDQDALSKVILNKIDSLKDIKAVRSGYSESRELVIKGKYPSALIINEGLHDSLESGGTIPIELLYDRSREMENAIVMQNLTYIIMSELDRYIFEANINKFIENSFPYIEKAMGEGLLSGDLFKDRKDISIKMTSLAGERFDKKLGLIQAVAGTAILMLLFSVAGVGTSILEEKENGTVNRLLYSPLKRSTILFSKMLFAFFISVFQLITMFLFARLVFGMPIDFQIPGLLLMIVATSFAVSALGIFLAAVAKTRHQAQNLSTIIILVMSAMGGSMIPLFIMPLFLQKMAMFSINYWSIQGFYDLFWRELPLYEILPKILVLTLFGVIMTTASVILFRKRMMKM